MKFTTVLPALSLAISALAAVPGNMRSKVVCRDEWETNCTYVSKGQIYDIWNGPGGGDFYRNFHEDIDWDVILVQGGYTFELANIIGGCNDEWSSQEILIQATLQSGMHIDEVTVWNTRWDAQTKRVRQARTYVDSWLTTFAFLDNEDATNSTWRNVRTDFIPGQYGMPNFTEVLGFPDGNSDDAPPLTSSYTITTKPFTNLNLPTDPITYPTATGTQVIPA
ncbi:hypothetical protein K432DRAFT_430741 [Lepidopterella palustris CBS 459.81]|uniref:Uncharacterized protein n=1 Tax=Lepidopterella palustris CBS 459.81 TaxID=1314670 RepID=A0A8E2DWL5_9PEZI|nr:hypothetical protein K432DRAFT_430741 [Lepidopterella palustris CBS 459.81]